MFNDPHTIADRLIEEHGIGGAIDMALEKTPSAHSTGDDLVSQGREIKPVSRDRKSR